MKFNRESVIFGYIKTYWYLENIGWLSSEELPNVNTFHSTIFKLSHSLIWSLQKSLPWRCQANGTSFPSLFTWKLKFYHCQQMLSVASLKVTVSFHSLLRKCWPQTKVWIPVCQLFFRVKMVFPEKLWLLGNIITRVFE